jgi:hypothetical protein
VSIFHRPQGDHQLSEPSKRLQEVIVNLDGNFGDFGGKLGVRSVGQVDGRHVVGQLAVVLGASQGLEEPVALLETVRPRVQQVSGKGRDDFVRKLELVVDVVEPDSEQVGISNRETREMVIRTKTLTIHAQSARIFDYE